MRYLHKQTCLSLVTVVVVVRKFSRQYKQQGTLVIVKAVMFVHLPEISRRHPGKTRLQNKFSYHSIVGPRRLLYISCMSANAFRDYLRGKVDDRDPEGRVIEATAINARIRRE